MMRARMTAGAAILAAFGSLALGGEITTRPLPKMTMRGRSRTRRAIPIQGVSRKRERAFQAKLRRHKVRMMHRRVAKARG